MVVDTNIALNVGAFVHNCVEEKKCEAPEMVMAEYLKHSGGDSRFWSRSIGRHVKIRKMRRMSNTFRKKALDKLRRICAPEFGHLDEADKDVLLIALYRKAQGRDVLVLSNDSEVNKCAMKFGIDVVNRPNYRVPKYILEEAEKALLELVPYAWPDTLE